MKKGIIVLLAMAGTVFTMSCTTNVVNENESNQVEKIGIIGAMDIEVDLLKESANVKKITKLADMDFCEGSLGENDVVIVKCGMGKVNAGICASILINEFDCTQIINTGCAGSLDNDMDIGDIVVSTETVQHDFDATHLGYKKGEVPYTGLYAFEADKNLRKIAVDTIKNAYTDVKVFEGRVCSGDQFISTKEQKDAIISNFGGLCCEMEGGAVAQSCYLHKVPFVILRVISDKPDETTFVEYQVFEKEASIKCEKIVRSMIERMHLN